MEQFGDCHHGIPGEAGHDRAMTAPVTCPPWRELACEQHTRVVYFRTPGGAILTCPLVWSRFGDRGDRRGGAEWRGDLLSPQGSQAAGADVARTWRGHTRHFWSHWRGRGADVARTVPVSRGGYVTRIKMYLSGSGGGSGGWGLIGGLPGGTGGWRGLARSPVQYCHGWRRVARRSLHPGKNDFPREIRAP